MKCNLIIRGAVTYYKAFWENLHISSQHIHIMIVLWNPRWPPVPLGNQDLSAPCLENSDTTNHYRKH